MSVAPSYEKYTIVGEVFIENDKTYVNIDKNGTLKKVRWYEPKLKDDKMDFDAYTVFGFAPNGFIYIFIGEDNIIEQWCLDNEYGRARYNTIAGWYLPSEYEPLNLPKEIKTIKINWTEVTNNKTHLTSFNELEDIINKKKYQINESISHYQGTVGEWLEKDIIIIDNIEIESSYGKAHLHIMQDNDSNIYVWLTSTKNWSINEKHSLRMKVKEHHNEKGVEQTIVYYCKERK